MKNEFLKNKKRKKTLFIQKSPKFYWRLPLTPQIVFRWKFSKKVIILSSKNPQTILKQRNIFKIKEI